MASDFSSLPKAKRRKVNGQGCIAEIKSVHDLRRLLIFQPDLQLVVKAAIAQLKGFLTSITGSNDDAVRVRGLEILRNYCKEQSATEKQDVPFYSFIALWSSAVENNDESILSSVPSVLALYLKTISSHLEFRDVGLSLCKSLLHKDQLRLFDRGLTATKTKDHLISPCLQLLTEIVSLDGGLVASFVYSKRDTTFRRLEVFLEHRPSNVPASGDEQQRPTLRRIAQKYLLANLKFQNVSAKGDIIAQGRAMRVCLQNLRSDRADIIIDILVSLEKDIVRASSLTKAIKGLLFTSSNLSSLASLYTFQEPAPIQPSDRTVRGQIDILLRLICTQPESGLMQPQNGWYPAGTNPERPSRQVADPHRISLHAASLFISGHGDKLTPKNAVLSAFIQALRPDSDTLQASLLLDVFRAAPELVADYFAKKRNFITEPKDTPAWLGQSAFLFSAIQLPVPKYCGWKDGYALLPPPTSVVIENILPRPLGRAHMTRSMNLNHEVITLFAVRALTVAFQKLSRVLIIYQGPTSDQENWKQASSNLISAFSQRCPLAKDILTTLQRAPKTDEKLRGSIIELLSKYYQLLPHQMLLEKFDISLALMDTIKRAEIVSEDQSRTSSVFLELENLLKIAHISPDTKWWHKSDLLHYSAFTSMLKAMLDANQSMSPIPSIRNLLRIIAVEHGILLDGSSYFDGLVTSLMRAQDWVPSSKAVAFFDNCACRIARQPAHYEDLATQVQGHRGPMCLLLFCIAEQWPFVVANEAGEGQENIAEWICRLLILLTGDGEAEDVIQELRDRMVNATDEAATRRIFRKSDWREFKNRISQEKLQEISLLAGEDNLPTVAEDSHPPFTIEALFEPRSKRIDFIEGLERLHQEDIGEVVVSGRLGRLCRSLSSLEEETRRQALIALQGILKQVELSQYSEKGPLYVLIGELVETVKSVGLARPLASILTEFAATAIALLDEPSHAMYGKISKFLQKGPVWDVSNFIQYWVGKILLREPENDNGLFPETSWLLNLLIQGLRDNVDMELYRKSNVFQRLLTLCSSILCPPPQRRQILELVYHSVSLGGGMTLVTRMGIESWLAITEVDGKDVDIIQALDSNLHDCIDREAAQQWKWPMVSSTIDAT